MSSRSLRAGLLGIAGLAAFYAIVVGIASGSTEHLLDQVRSDWWLLTPITIGFGTQVALMSELRRRHHASSLAASAASAGAGTSAAGMIACCAHHLAELVPFLGLTGVATTLTAWRTEMMLVGLAINVIAIVLAARRLRDVTIRTREPDACATA